MLLKYFAYVFCCLSHGEWYVTFSLGGISKKCSQGVIKQRNKLFLTLIEELFMFVFRGFADNKKHNQPYPFTYEGRNTNCRLFSNFLTSRQEVDPSYVFVCVVLCTTCRAGAFCSTVLHILVALSSSIFPVLTASQRLCLVMLKVLQCLEINCHALCSWP